MAYRINVATSAIVATDYVVTCFNFGAHFWGFNTFVNIYASMVAAFISTVAGAIKPFVESDTFRIGIARTEFFGNWRQVKRFNGYYRPNSKDENL